LDEYLVFFILFLWEPFCSKDLGHSRELKNGTIMLKFGTPVPKTKDFEKIIKEMSPDIHPILFLQKL